MAPVDEVFIAEAAAVRGRGGRGYIIYMVWLGSSADASISTLPSPFLCHSPTLAVNLLLSSAGK
jgi:hypothetical protein